MKPLLVKLPIIVIFFMLVGMHNTTLALPITEPDDETPVIVAEDKTKEAQCIKWVDSPKNVRPCPPGSVIFTRETTYGEVKQKGIKDYTILTGDSSIDNLLTNQVANHAHSRMSPISEISDFTLQSCRATTNKRIGGSYLSKINDANSTRISYEVEYDVNAGCDVTNVSDRAKTSGERLTWAQTCTGRNGNVLTNCNAWSQHINGNWFGWLPEQSSRIGAQYTHISYIGLFSARPYGFTSFTD